MRQEGEIILDNSRIRIYELKYDLYDLVDKYKMRRVIFPNQNISLTEMAEAAATSTTFFI